MSKRAQVPAAIKAIAVAALPGADVVGLTDDADRPRRIPANGLVIVRDGDPGEAEVDLSPPLYHFEHEIQIELAAYRADTPLRERLGIMAGAIGAGIAADRTLGGLCTYVDFGPLEIVDIIEAGGATQLGGMFTVTASYSTPNPLG